MNISKLEEVKARILFLVFQQTNNPEARLIAREHAEKFVEVNRNNVLFASKVDIDWTARESIREDIQTLKKYRTLFVRSVPLWRKLLFRSQWMNEIRGYDEFISLEEKI